jgi:hypothetical protein
MDNVEINDTDLLEEEPKDGKLLEEDLEDDVLFPSDEEESDEFLDFDSFDDINE